ncbi:ABC transporter ATP-binding protein [Tersicoccus solisilvae]|uniref:ABC transporter ATP-binding protein n=1 Tax=Tersicoccus solisilvae TaxID=1882339 RepID=A0ABQ1NLW0_9MICC|nr:ATP-binding cassette domain-containing protein [Tersicoccus solisilvae]GGC80403.1 ABC transporter ATP-binding protein [Tersicoccus solisilvae]
MPGSGGPRGARPAAVEARGWGWRHGGRRAAAVDGLDLRIEPGERVLLLGPSGAGKSTVLHGLAGLLDPQDADVRGQLLIDGIPASRARGRAGLLQQDPEAQIVLSRVGDDVAFGPENLAVPREAIWPRVRTALDAVGLTLPLDHPTGELSGGQQQRLGLAGLLAMAPGLLLLDEPTANLDPAGVLQVRDAVAAALDATGATLVVVEHRVAVWAPVVDRVVVLAPVVDGTTSGVTHDGPIETVLATHGAELAAAGIWVPGHEPVVPARSDVAGETLLTARDLAVSRLARTSRRRDRSAGRHRGRVEVAAAGIDVTLAAGRALSVTGPNGAGKSTLALTLAGLLPSVAGTVAATPSLAGTAGPDPYRWRPGQLIARIGTVFQEPEHQFVTGSVREELAFGPRHAADARAVPGGPAALDARVDELLDRLRLTHLAAANPFTLSGGEKRRLSVATVLAAGPRVVVLDEPTFGQDALTWRHLVDLLSGLLDEGRAVVAVTHDAAFSAALAGDRLDLPGRADSPAGVGASEPAPVEAR